MRISLRSTALLSCIAAIAISAKPAEAIYNSPYFIEAQYSGLTATGISGTCSNPSFSQATNDGIGSFIGMQGYNYYNQTAIGVSIGRYSPPVNAYSGYFVDNAQYTQSGTLTETFYPFSNRTVQSSSSYQVTYTSSSSASSTINGQTAASSLTENYPTWAFDIVGLQQAIASGGSPQVFANFTSGANCSSLQYQPQNGSFTSWPASTGNDLNVVVKDPPNETSGAGNYSSQTFTITH